MIWKFFYVSFFICKRYMYISMCFPPPYKILCIFFWWTKNISIAMAKVFSSFSCTQMIPEIYIFRKYVGWQRAFWSNNFKWDTDNMLTDPLMFYWPSLKASNQSKISLFLAVSDLMTKGSGKNAWNLLGFELKFVITITSSKLHYFCIVFLQIFLRNQ